MDIRVWEPRAVLGRTVWCESELDWVQEGFLQRDVPLAPKLATLVSSRLCH